ncbi:MAG: tyrosine-type recombinase/integrase [Methylotenera sp.]|nr:tyrosine-type recombinase/integrase [Methylotenera sp.]
MTIKQVKTGWQVDIQPGGRTGKRIKKTHATKAEAIAWERFIQAKVQESPEWSPPKKDARLVSDLVELWYQHHGAELKDGLGRKRILLAMCEAMGNPRAEKFTPDQFATYRMKRIDDGIKPNTMNREQAYLRAVFNETIRLGHWKKENPLVKLRAFKIQEQELSFLTLQQVLVLLNRLSISKNIHVTLISKVCLSTGGRWGEAEGLRISQVRGGMIQFVQTKSSKARSVPISEELEKELIAHHEKNGIGERLFISAYSAFREAIEQTKLKLSVGQLTHILRHTFASHFMMNGGNIIALQKILGHHSLAMTMRYAHLSPEHLQETLQLNPLARLNLG